MIERTLATKMISLAQKFQVITLTGPRQSGKTTLVRAAFPTFPYVSLEEPDIRQLALTDPRGFLSGGRGAVDRDPVGLAAAEADPGLDGEPVEGERDAPGRGEVQLRIAFPPVLDEREVDVRARRRSRCIHPPR